MRKLTYYVATTVDGFIAREDGSFTDFPPADYEADFLASLDDFEYVLMGRKTYDIGLKIGITNPYPTLKGYVFSRTLPDNVDPNITLIRDGGSDVVRKLKQEGDKGIWLCGGAELASQFFQEKLIDELIVKVNPVLFGTGIPLLARTTKIDLERTNVKTFAGGTTFLYYNVKY